MNEKENNALNVITDAEVKEYIKEKFTLDKKTAKGVLLSAYIMSGEISIGQKGKSLTFTFKNIFAAFLFCDAMNVRFKYSPELKMEIPTDGRRSRKLIAEILEFKALDFLVDLGMAKVDKNGKFKSLNFDFELEEELRSGFFAELYLETGKLSYYDDYRLELSLPDVNKCNKIAHLLREIEINVGVKDNGVVLLRTNAIYYYLALCGANKYAIEISEYYVQRDKNRQLSRLSNFETANTDKAFAASAYQCWAIQTLRNADKLSSLGTDRLKLALLREQKPEASLGELAAELGISKSTAFHRMKAITDLAETYRQQ